MFAGRGIPIPAPLATALVVVLAFGAGIGAGWATGSIPDMLEAGPLPSFNAEPSAPGPAAEPSVPPLSVISRTITADDLAAGITTTDYEYRASGTFTIVPGAGEPSADADSVRWVSISVEDGLDLDPEKFASYAVGVLNDNRGWGTDKSIEFVRTDGVADVRIMLASPYTAAVLCPDPHVVAETAAEEGQAAEPSATADDTAKVPAGSEGAAEDSPSKAPEAGDEPRCAVDGVLVISIYDWTAGLPGFANDYAGARAYWLNHLMGHLMGRKDVECTGGRADVMASQREEMTVCAPNPWPYPEAKALVEQPEATASAAPDPADVG